MAAGIPPPRYILIQEDWQLCPLVVRFNGHPSHLAHFLAQVRHHMEHYGAMYPYGATQVHVIIVNLEDSASEWLVSLHDEETPGLDDLDTFMQAL